MRVTYCHLSFTGWNERKGRAVTEVATRREYPNPPIVEVILQVAFAEPVSWSAASPGLLYSEIRKAYPAEPKAQTAIEAEINGETSNLQVGRGAQRIIYSNDEQNRRIVANETNLSVNALLPYEQWESLAERFQAAMTSYQKAIAKFTPKTVSLRYINKIVVPFKEVDLSTYFTVPIAFSHRKDAVLRNFVSRTESLCEDDGIGITVTFGSAAGHDVPEQSAFILDIDLEVPAPADADFSALCELASQLHHWENNEFESSITENSRELFR